MTTRAEPMPMDQATTPEDTEASSASATKDFLEGFISEPEYARQRGVALRTCQRDRQLRKAPPYIKLGRQVFYRIEAVRDWLMKNERIADQTPEAPRSRSLRNPYLLPRGTRQRPSFNGDCDGRSNSHSFQK